MIKVVDNYIGLSNNDKTITQIKNLNLTGYYCEVYRGQKENIQISLNDYINKAKSNILFSFFSDLEKQSSSDDDLIISLDKDESIFQAQTGNYIGQFVWDGLKVDIKSRFSNSFLERMLNFANDIYLDDVSVFGKESKKELDISKYIIYYMFIQNLEKAFLLGIPKEYKTIKHHEMKVKGKIDVKSFIKKDIPFKGKISSVNREQKEIQEIIDILYKAVKVIDTNGFNTKNISHIKTHLKQNRSNNYVSNETINKAIKSKALQNPIYAPYKKVLEYAKYILNSNSIEESNKNENKETYGFLINVAELFEIYITKLLQLNFSDWYISSPRIELYPNQFFVRKIIPDIVMEKGKDLLVFDTKYKRMKFRNRYQGTDVDRNDFFQINTYMSYYKNQGFNVIVGGLLYPIEKEFDEMKCYSDNWFGNYETKFIIDGIDLSSLNDNSKMSEIKSVENKFIERIRDLI